MSAARNPAVFSARTVLVLLLFGAIAFIAALYFIGTGEEREGSTDGGAHAAGNGLTGYAAFVDLLEAEGHEVELIRNPGRLEEESLLILTPPLYADVEEINQIITNRRYIGPTLVILPKWMAYRIPASARSTVKAKDGWVMLVNAATPEWAADIGREGMIDVALEPREKGAPGWSGLGITGHLPDGKALQTMSSGSLTALVSDDKGQTLAAYWDDDGVYPVLAESAGVSANYNDTADEDYWPVVIVAEPDLMNNYGMADRNRAVLAHAIVDATLEEYDLPIKFDVTLNGLGRNQNLLTLAFTPPFLAATLCLILAAIVVAWRALRRFGPPLAETPVFAFGKRQLARNVAALIQRSRRLHLLGAPYAAIMRARVAHLLGLKPGGDAAQAEAAIDMMLARRGLDPAGFTRNANALRKAGNSHELLRRAHALKQIERTLSK